MESDEAATASPQASGGTVTPAPKKRGRKPKNKDESQEQISGGKMKESGKKTKQQEEQSVDEKYSQWKGLVPILYDWLANHNLVWPSLSCRWGPQLDQATYKNRQRLYLSEQTDGSVPNTLVIANCEVVKPRVAAAEHISQFNEEARSPFVKKYKTIIHPGEVNRIRELPQNSKIVATHTDSPDVLIWDVETQPNRHAVLGAASSRPDLILTGHQDNAEFALAMCPTEPFVLSGGKDKMVVLWSIQDHITTVGTDSKSSGSIIKQTGEGGDKTESPSVGPRGVYQGHDDTVEDVAFSPTSAQEFCSVGDDSCLILWDARTGTSPVKFPQSIRTHTQSLRLNRLKTQKQRITERRSLIVVRSITEDREAIDVKKSDTFDPQEEPNAEEIDRDTDRLMSRGINAAIVLAAGTVAVTKLLSIDHDYWHGWTLYEILRYAPEHNWVAYEQILKTNPVLAKMAISGVVYSLGDWIAQCYEGKPLFEFDRTRVLRSGLVGFTLHGSLSHYYYQFCEALFPFQDWWVVPAKVAFDQTVWSAIWNTIYYTVLGLLRFQSPDKIFGEIKTTFWPMITAGWKLWPLAHLVTYGVIPVDQRLLWVDCIELIWVTILSTYSNEKAEAQTMGETNSSSTED